MIIRKTTKIDFAIVCILGLIIFCYLTNKPDSSVISEKIVADTFPDDYYNQTCRGTLVTAYYNISSKYPFSDYLEWMTNFLRLEDCLVIVISPELAPLIKSLRPPEYPTFIVKKPIEHLQIRKELTEKEWLAQEQLDPNLNLGHNKLLYTIWNEKVNFLQMAAALNPFNSDHFVWLDISAIRHDAFRDEKILKHFAQEPGITLLEISAFQQADLVFEEDNINLGDFTQKDRVAASMFGGTKDSIDSWHQGYYKVFRSHAKQGRFIGKEQGLLANTCLATGLCLLKKQASKEANWSFMMDYFRGIVLDQEPRRLVLKRHGLNLNKIN